MKQWRERLSQEQQKHRQELEEAAVAAEARVHSEQTSRCQEMDAVEKKVKDVMHRKNMTIQRHAMYRYHVLKNQAVMEKLHREAAPAFLQVTKVVG